MIRARIVVLACAAVTMAAVDVVAQPLLSTQPLWTTGGGDRAILLLTADVDADGDPDVLRVHPQQPSQLFLAKNGALDVTPAWVSLFTRTVTGAALADLNNDGKLDLVLATLDGDANVYLQAQLSSVFPAQPDFDIPMRGATAIALAELSGDRLFDVVSGDGDSLYVRHNLDRAAFSDPVWQVAGGADRLALADVDRDGELDLVASGGGSGLRLYRGTRGSFELTPAWNVAGEMPSGLALGDLDGDGDFDLVTAAAAPPAAPAPTRIWENLGSTFGVAPAFVLTAEDSTLSVALADADADGDLDLACANADRSRVYRHGTGLGSWTQAWQSPDALATACAWADIDGNGHSELILAHGQTAWFQNLTPLFGSQAQATAVPGTPLAVADVDGDGDADLVTASGTAARVYVQTDGIFGDVPKWTSTGVDRPLAAALGDVGLDGRPDLVLGGSDAVAVYESSPDSIFATPPVWRVPFPEVSAIALGDVDGDGDLDLVAASSGALSEVRLYVNRGVGLAVVPDWTHRPTGEVSSLALGDIDGDGDLDLAVGSRTSGATCFAYFQGQYGDGPFWTPQEQAAAVDVFIDDLNRDGRPDIAVANNGFSMSFHNLGGFFDTIPSWTAPVARRTSAAALEDLDADGDLDLMLFSDSGDVSEVHFNIGGLYAPAVPLPVAGWRGVQVADIDRDGDFDLVSGTLAAVELYSGTSMPPFRTDLESPKHHLPANDVFIRNVQVTIPRVNVRHVALEAVDVESDSLWILAEYQPRGSGSWLPIATGAGRGRLGPVASSPAGAAYEFEWELERIESNDAPLAMRLRSTPYRPQSSALQRVPSYLQALGRVDVRRPEIQVTPAQHGFPTITVGDTISEIFTIRNTGTVALQISAFQFERTKMMRTNPIAPLELSPGQRAEVFVHYEPTGLEFTAPPGAPRLFVIESNDPIYSRRVIEIEADAYALEGRAQALVTGRAAPLGEPIVVQAIPAPLVHIEQARLYYGDYGNDTFDVIAMTRLGASFIATIPGPRVTELSVQFYVEFENSGIVATDPPAPLDSLLVVPVEPPDAITVIPQPTARADFLVGRDISVQVIVPQGAEVQDGTLYYRKGGDIDYTDVPIEIGLSFQYRAIIPGKDVTARGLQYWVEVLTLTRRIQYPLDGELTPDSIATLVPSLVEAGSTPGGRYRMLAVPLDFGEASPDALDVLLSDQPEFGPYDPVRWRAFRYLGDTFGTIERTAGDPRFFVEPGRAFWLISRDPHRVDSAPAEGLSIPVSEPFRFRLDPGWNQIGAPFAFPVEWSTVALPEGVEPPVAFDPARGTRGDYAPDSPARIEPFQGYFIYNATDSVLTLEVPPVVADSVAAASAAKVRPASAGGFWIDLTVSGAASQDGGNRAGTDTRASDDRDALDAHEPPTMPGGGVRAAFVAADGAALLRRDWRAPNDSGHTWTLDVRSEAAGQELGLDVRIEGDVPAGFEVAILDDDARTVIPVTRPPVGAPGPWSARLALLGHGRERAVRLRVVAGTPEYVAGAKDETVAAVPPARLVLEQNAPNPFNATTRLRFGLPRAGRVQFDVFDVRGRHVVRLWDGPREAGWHSVLWNGRDDSGHAVASGVYIARLRTDEGSVTRRLVAIE